ncbi:transcriptional regulator [Methylophilaceae bacterium 11]|jgi:AcrR family transcriptional regulator|uniref:TetR/AcrR family transcriptional regulator n=1 Tax=Methylotenera sp. N17 TaxID=1502761 RepID=UPI00044F8414|nr:TetR/AcrR family transcriptional regulator [Methylotenera sp. N17]EUJ09754.1 transcriptional regulator [Methylophilaceae bacterium 11]
MSVLRERILSTATDLFQTRGINSTGVDTIVAEAGTTKMTLYKYFRTKEELILEVLRKSQSDFQSWLDLKFSTSNQKPTEKIQQLFDFIEEWVSSPSFLGMGFIKASAEFPDEQNPIHQLSSQQSRDFRLYIAKLAADANIQDADGLALQLSLLFEGAVQAEQMKRGSGAIKYAKQAAKILIDGARK